MFQTKVVEKIKTHSLCSGTCVCVCVCVFLNRAVYEVMWKNIVEPERPRMKIRRMRIAEHLGLQTHWKYVIIFAFPLWQWLHQRTSAVRYT
jgi:hypothetical protein